MALSTRVDDYLSDKIQTPADLETINDLLAKVREQQHLLRNQLSSAKSDLAQAEATAKKHETSLSDKISNFQRNQADIDRRIQSLTQSSVSDDAIEIFESRMQKLRRLETAAGYVETLKEVDILVTDARNQLHSPEDALGKHRRVRTLLQGLQQAQRAADQAAPHLIDQVEEQVDALSRDLKQRLEKDFQQTLEKMHWPKKDIQLSGNAVDIWTTQVNNLLELQEANVSAILQGSAKGPESVVLLPLEIMVRPLAVRFQYHFYGDRPTNRLDKPEYFFSHLLDLLEQHTPFLSQVFQSILDARSQKSDALDLYYTDAISSYITALLPMILTKCLSVLPQISKQPQLLSHFIHEVMMFDTTLRDSWGYTPVPGLFADWRGLTWEILESHNYFNTWLEVEKSFALSRYKKIRDSPDSNQIDYDTVESSRTKPTKGAMRVHDLLETVTERYKSLPSFIQKIKFFLDIQLSIFDDYHGHLKDAYQAYLVSSHTAGRLLQGGGQSQDDAMGMKGLETLVKVFGSAEYLEKKMADWSEEVFFLEMWEELEDRAKRSNAGRDGNVGQDLTIAEVASKTSSTIQPDADNTDNDGEGGGALFDEISKTYQKLREGAETEIVRALETLARNALKPYGRVSVWSSLSGASSDISNLTPTSALDTLLSVLSTLLTFLSRTLAVSPLRRILRPVCGAIQKDLIDNIIMKNTFSAAGAMQLYRDILAIQDVIDTSAPMASDSKRSMKKLGQILHLLNLPIKQSTRKSNGSVEISNADDDNSQADGEGDEWGFDEQTEDNELIDGSNEDEENKWGLWEAERAIFASNESARKALAAMSIESISETEARNVIRRRIELSS